MKICNYLKKLLKYSSIFQLHAWLHEDEFPSYTSTNVRNSHGLDAEAAMRIQLPSTKSDVKAVYRNVEQCLSSH